MKKVCGKSLLALYCLAVFFSAWPASWVLAQDTASVSSMEIVYDDGQLIIGRKPLPEGLQQAGVQSATEVPVVTLYSTITTKNAPQGQNDDWLYEPALEPGAAYVGAAVSTTQEFTPYIKVGFAGESIAFMTSFNLPFPLLTGYIYYIYSPVPAEVQAIPGLYRFSFTARTTKGRLGVTVARGACRFIMKEATLAE